MKNITNMSPEEVDAVIISRLKTLPAKGNKGTNSRAGKWNDSELELRDSVIMAYLTENCLSREQTAQQISQRWDITLGTARKYVSEAIKRFCESFNDDYEHLKKMFLERCETILASALTNGQKAEALKALDMIGKSVGSYRETKDVNVNGDINISFDFE